MHPEGLTKRNRIVQYSYGGNHGSDIAIGQEEKSRAGTLNVGFCPGMLRAELESASIPPVA